MVRVKRREHFEVINQAWPVPTAIPSRDEDPSTVTLHHLDADPRRDVQGRFPKASQILGSRLISEAGNPRIQYGLRVKVPKPRVPENLLHSGLPEESGF